MARRVRKARVPKNKVVDLAYTLKDDDGAVIEQATAARPLIYMHGYAEIIEGLEHALDGRRLGARFQVSVPPELGYGRRISPPHPLPRSAFDEGADLSPGSVHTAHTDQGEDLAIWVVEADEDAVWVDMQHPMSGKTLHFDVEILAIRMATEAEREAGRADQPEAAEKADDGDAVDSSEELTSV